MHLLESNIWSHWLYSIFIPRQTRIISCTSILRWMDLLILKDHTSYNKQFIEPVFGKFTLISIFILDEINIWPRRWWKSSKLETMSHFSRKRWSSPRSRGARTDAYDVTVRFHCYSWFSFIMIVLWTRGEKIIIQKDMMQSLLRSVLHVNLCMLVICIINLYE